MRTLNIIIDESGGVKSSAFAGHAGEHNAVVISVEFEKFPEECRYFRMLFSSNDGQSSIISAPITPQNQKLSYSLPKSVTTLSGSVAWQLCGYRAEGGTLKNIVKSSVVSLNFGKSLADTTSTVETELKNTVEEELGQLEDFLENFDITASVVKTSDFGLSCQKSGNKYNITLNTPTALLASRQRKNQTDFDENDLFGNKFIKTDKAGEYLAFERVGNMVTVSGTVCYSPDATRNHTENGCDSVVLYLPFKPLQYTYVSIGGNTTKLFWLSPAASTLNFSSSSSASETIRLCFTYICEDK